MKTLIILSAIPASGKSTWALKYQKEHENTYIVSSDEIRAEVNNGDYHNYSKQALVWETFSKRIHEYGKIENVTVILDALNDLNSLRRKYVEENPEFDKYILVLFPFDVDKSMELNAKRDFNGRVPDEAMRRLIDKFEMLDDKTRELFDEVINVGW